MHLCMYMYMTATYRRSFAAVNTRIVCFCKNLKIAAMLTENSLSVYVHMYCVCVKHALICAYAKESTRVGVCTVNNKEFRQSQGAARLKLITFLIMCHMHLFCLFTFIIFVYFPVICATAQ